MIHNFGDSNEFSHLFRKEIIPSKTTLLEEGKMANTIYFIEQGCIRSWFNNNGKDITVQFFFEEDQVASIESFRTNRPSLFTLESIEKTIVYCLEKKDFEFIMENSPSIKKYVEDKIFERLVFYQHLFLSRIKNNPYERYNELIQTHPKILQRVPQHYIASYLGITSVSLSRIRNRRT